MVNLRNVFNLAILGLAALPFTAAAQDATALAPKAFNHLPLGNVMPAGWLKDQMAVQTSGLAGNTMNFYDYVNDTDWLGGDSYYSTLEEAGAYWFNAAVPHGVVADSEALKTRAQAFLDFVLAHQEPEGWFGPEVFDSTKPRYLWGRYLFLFGLIQTLEIDPSQESTIVPAMQKFVTLAHSMLVAGTNQEEWGQSRWEEFQISLQWLYENYPEGNGVNQTMLLDMMTILRSTGAPWELVFLPEYFPTGPVEDIANPFDNQPLIWHGVSLAEGLKALAVSYRYTHNATELEVASSGWDLVFQYHGRPSGIFAADEYLAGLQAIRGTEFCDVIETMFSGSYLYEVIGDVKFADRVERVAYNAFPGTITGSMWSRQYLQQQNQVAAQTMNPNPFPEDGPYSNVFGLEPNYPCCTVNHPTGYPKFISHAFMTTPDLKSLVHLYLGPFSTSTALANGNKVQVEVDTLYPFGDTLTTTVTADAPFTYYVRVPSWVTNGTASVNGAAAKPVSGNANGLQAFNLSAGKTTIVLDYPAAITIESRPENSIAVHRGPLHYAFDIARNQTVLTQNSLQPLAVDLQFEATDAWAYAIDPDTLVFHNKPPTSGVLPSPVFDAGLPPYTITATACPISWSLAGDKFVTSPPTNPACIGSQSTITLWPYGATKLRIGEFPTFTSS